MAGDGGVATLEQESQLEEALPEEIASNAKKLIETTRSILKSPNLKLLQLPKEEMTRALKRLGKPFGNLDTIIFSLGESDECTIQYNPDDPNYIYIYRHSLENEEDQETATFEAPTEKDPGIEPLISYESREDFTKEPISGKHQPIVNTEQAVGKSEALVKKLADAISLGAAVPSAAAA